MLFTPAHRPKKLLLLPEVIDAPALVPMPILLLPDVKDFAALNPTKKLLTPVVLDGNEVIAQEYKLVVLYHRLPIERKAEA